MEFHCKFSPAPNKTTDKKQVMIRTQVQLIEISTQS